MPRSIRLEIPAPNSRVRIAGLLAAISLAACVDSPVTAPVAKDVARVGASVAEASSTAAGVGTLGLTRFAYAWANSPTSPSYVPNGKFSFNGSGGFIRIDRFGVGSYNVVFDGQAKLNRAYVKETILVTAYGNTSARCIVGGWGDVVGTDDLGVRVRCSGPARAAALDVMFTILMVGDGSLPGAMGFAWADQPSSASYAPLPSYSWSSAGGTPTITRLYPGYYHVNLGHIPLPPGRKVAHLITAYGDPSHFCAISQSYSLPPIVQCSSRGNPVDSYFDVLAIERGRTGSRMAWLMASKPNAAAPYTPPASLSYNSSGGSMRVTHTGVGSYTVRFYGLQRLPGDRETVQVSSSGGYSGHYAACSVVRWGNSSGALDASVQCRGHTGVPMESVFAILVIQ